MNDDNWRGDPAKAVAQIRDEFKVPERMKVTNFVRNLWDKAYPSDKIYKVKYIGASNDQVNFGGNDDPRGILLLNTVYEVAEFDVHSYYTKIKLVNTSGWFNDVSFQYINGEPNKKELYQDMQH